MDKNFKIKGVGLDTSTLNYPLYVSEESKKFDYIHTSISAINDFEIGFVPEDAKLVTTINFLDNARVAIKNHLEELNRDSIDLLMIDASCDIVKYFDVIKSLVDTQIVKTVGLSNPKKLDDLKKFREYIGAYCYVSLDLCPFSFNYDIVNWCEENDIDIIGFNPFGGHINSNNIIDCFSVPYLLEFSATYCAAVFLSGRDLFHSGKSCEYLKNLIDAETSPRYLLKKNVNKLVKPLAKTIHTALKIDENTIIPFNTPDALYNNDELIMSFDNIDLKFVDKSAIKDEETGEVYSALDDLEMAVYSLYKEIKKPEDGDDFSILSLMLHKVKLLCNNVDDAVNVLLTKAGDKLFIFTIKTEKVEEHFFKNKIIKDTKHYLLYYKDKEFLFQKINYDNIDVEE